MKKIVLTGGGTAGHVTPNLALIPYLQREGFDIYYIGSKEGIEKRLLSDYDIPYYGISTGKLRRYFDIKNFTDPFKVLSGIGEARSIIKKIKPNVIFSKGGFVSVPVILGGSMNKVPIIIHESDITPGLANKISIPFAKNVCCNFPETLKYLPKEKGSITGTPIRSDLYEGDRNKGLQICGFKGDKPIIMIIGGSLGSKIINNVLRNSLDILSNDFDIIHLCGKNNKDHTIKNNSYIQFEYVKEDLKHMFNISDLIVSRAGANSIFEILSLKKPNLLIPLSANASRGDQILNAESFSKRGFSLVLQEEDMNKYTFCDSIYKLHKKKDIYIENMNSVKENNGIKSVMDIIKNNI